MFGTFQATQLLSQLVNSAAVAGGIRQHVGKRGDWPNLLVDTEMRVPCSFHRSGNILFGIFQLFRNKALP